MQSVRKKIIAAGVITLAIVCALPFAKVRPPVRIAVYGFITNRYTVFPGDYVCVIVDVTNTSKEAVTCKFRDPYDSRGGGRTGRAGNVKPYYEFREGGFEIGTLPPHSGFRFEALAYRNSTNQIALGVHLEPRKALLLGQLPAKVKSKLPNFLFPSPREFWATTQPFFVGNTNASP